MADSIIADATTRIFRDLCDPQTVNNATDEAWKAPLWEALEEAGLTAAMIPEALGGAGITFNHAGDILRISGQFAAPVPIAETMLAGWLLAGAGLTFPGGAIAVAPARAQDVDVLEIDSDGLVQGTARFVSHAHDSDRIAVLARRGDGAAVALVATGDCAVTPGTSLAGDSLDTVNFSGVTPEAIGDATPERADELMLMGAMARAAQMAGALETLLDISVSYAGERIAFERPIARFQAVQHNLARLAGETAAAVCASSSAADAIEREGPSSMPALLEAAAAKIRVGEAAGEGAAIAHQVHGAIGFTDEHILHRFTRRLWSWRDEFGSESVWAVRLGKQIAASGSDGLWPVLAER